MKILIVNRALGTLFGGGESFDYNAARFLASRGHQVTLITGKPLRGAIKNTFPELNVIYVATPNLRRFAYATEKVSSKLSAAFYHLDNALFEWAVLRWFAAQSKHVFDIVHCCSLFTLPEKLLNRYKQPVISWLPGPPSGRTRNRLLRLVSKSHFGLFAHGSPEWTLLDMDFVRGKEYEIIEPGIDLSSIDAISSDRCARCKQLGIKIDDTLGITVARLVPVKNHKLLLTALAGAKKRGVVWQWLLVGDGPLASSLKLHAQSLDIASQVHFLGQQNQQEVQAWLAVADLFALTSSYENFSIATLEAMAHKLPIIGTKVGYLEVLIKEAKAGRVVSHTDPRELEDTLVEMSTDKNRSEFGLASRQFVERLDWPVIAQRLESFYQQIIMGRDL